MKVFGRRNMAEKDEADMKQEEQNELLWLALGEIVHQRMWPDSSMDRWLDKAVIPSMEQSYESIQPLAKYQDNSVGFGQLR
jgi:hypothetical protein